ncbi:MAG: NADH-quinone oxidoreductase subunit M [bacterium]|nr:NADH-quinone oxidoreductase subunit M [bacterium]
MLPLLIAVPFLGAGIIFVAPRASAKRIATAFASLMFAGGLLTLPLFHLGQKGFQFLSAWDWIPSIGISFKVGVDGLSYPLVLLTLFLGFIVTLLPFPHVPEGVERKERAYWGILLLLIGVIVGVFVSLDLFVFYIFWELVLVFMFFLIMLWGGENRRYAGMKFFIYTQAASLIMLVGIIALYLYAGMHTFDLTQLANASLPFRLQYMIMWAFLISFFVKIPAVPFHTWLPDAHVEAPTAGSVLLAGVLLKMGAYGILRIPGTITPDALHSIAWGLGIFAFISIVYGALVSLAQDNIKRLIAYSSVNHMGYALLGIAAFTPLAYQGAVYVMVSHGVLAGLLFALAGAIHDKTGTFSIARLKGLMEKMPRLSWIFVIAALGSMGVPAMSGFVSEFMVFAGSYSVYGGLLLIPLLGGVVITAGYFLWTLERVFFGASTPEWGSLVDITRRMAVPFVVLAAVSLFLGLYPTWLLSIVQASRFF